MPFYIVEKDIEEMKVDCIVNYIPFEFKQAVSAKAPFKITDVDITNGLGRNAKYVILARGPQYVDGKHDEKQLLRQTYRNIFKLSAHYDIETIAVPLITSADNNYPLAQALETAEQAIGDYLANNSKEVYLVINDKTLLKPDTELIEYLHNTQKSTYDISEYRHVNIKQARELFSGAEREVTATAYPSFQAVLNVLMKRANLRAFYVYNQANLYVDKFIQEIKKESYYPNKDIIIALALALRLDITDLKSLLELYGFKLDIASNKDMVVEYCFANNIYNIIEINTMLFILGVDTLANNK